MIDLDKLPKGIVIDPDFSNGMIKVNSTEVSVLVKLEATGGSLSLIGVTLIFITYAWSKRLRTLPNTFIFFASIANVGASIACLIGHTGLGQLNQLQNEASNDEDFDSAINHAPLCATQAFLLEMFMQSDPWWSFAMAFNVFLVFFFQANPDSFRGWLWLYCLICFGGPAIPAIACLLLKFPDENNIMRPIYGDATLWCWINANAAVLRIWTYYLPIWICIAGSILIYFAVGYHVFRQRNQLKNLTLSNPEKNELAASDIRDSADKGPESPREFYGTKITEIEITTSNSSTSGSFPATLHRPQPTITTCRAKHWTPPTDEEFGGSHGVPSAGPFQSVSSVSSERPRTKSTSEKLATIWRRCLRRLTKMDPVKMSYLKNSFVFAFSVLVTWTPSSILRIHDLVKPNQFNFPLNVAAAIVLPLQGAWNAVIYFSTSWNVLKEEFLDSRSRFQMRRGERGRGPSNLDGMRAPHLRHGPRVDKTQVRIQRMDTNNSDVELKKVPAGNSNIRAMRGSF